MRDKTMQQKIQGISIHVILTVLAAAAFLSTAGCAGSGNANSSGAVQIPPAGTQGSKSYTYAGTQSADGSITNEGNNFGYGGAWTSSLDDTNNYFSYENTGHVGGPILTSGNSEVILPYAIPVAGDDSGSGFHSLTPAVAGSATGSGGYAVELPGEGQLLRPNTQTIDGLTNSNDLHPSSPMVAPVVSAASANCPSLKGNATYQFIAMGSQMQNDLIEHVVYGSVQISGSGTAFTFSNLSMYGFSGGLPVSCRATGGELRHDPSGLCHQQYSHGTVLLLFNGSATSPQSGSFTLHHFAQPIRPLRDGSRAGIAPILRVMERAVELRYRALPICWGSWECNNRRVLLTLAASSAVSISALSTTLSMSACTLLVPTPFRLGRSRAREQ